MAIPDITVMGAGIFGLSIAFACVRRGAAVVVRDRRGVGAGASGGILGAMAPHVPEAWNAKKAFQLESLLMSETFWRDIDEASGLDSGYARLGRLQPIPDAAALGLARSREKSAADCWQGKAEWRVVRAGEVGWAPASNTGFLIRDTLSARIHPRRACRSLAEAILRAGGKVETGADQAGGRVVWATGYEGLAALADRLRKPVGIGVKGQAILLRHDVREEPQLFADGIHIVPHDDGTVAVGSTSERFFTHAGATDAQCGNLLERALGICPALRGAVIVERWAGVRPRARSRAPMLGAWPGRPGHFIANGGFKIGFGMAPKIGEIIADLILDGTDRIPEEFRVEANM